MKFKQKSLAQRFLWTTFFALAFFSVCLLPASSVRAQQQQTGDDSDALATKAAELIKQQKYLEVLPILEKLAVATPDNAYVHYHLAFALLSQAANTKDVKARPPLRIRARNEFIKAKQLEVPEPNVDALILSLPQDGSESGNFSQIQAAHQAMEEGEAAFTQGKLDDAFKAYQRALQLDPKLYEAALFSGDVFSQKNDFANAEIWYQKAIAIDPNRETAYRYSATPLMKQRKYIEARDRYIEAYISEPYSNFSRAGLTQWAQATDSLLGHPKIVVPTDVSFDEKGNAKVNLDASALIGGKDDGSFAWISYGATRSAWHKEKFAKTFPSEKTYRHSLAEEADALRSVVVIASEKNKDLKQLSPSLATLKKLNDAGLLEAYILLAQPDRDIARDYPNYLKNNRAKLRQYVTEYVVTGGGK